GQRAERHGERRAQPRRQREVRRVRGQPGQPGQPRVAEAGQRAVRRAQPVAPPLLVERVGRIQRPARHVVDHGQQPVVDGYGRGTVDGTDRPASGEARLGQVFGDGEPGEQARVLRGGRQGHEEVPVVDAYPPAAVRERRDVLRGVLPPRTEDGPDQLIRGHEAGYPGIRWYPVSADPPNRRIASRQVPASLRTRWSMLVYGG